MADERITKAQRWLDLIACLLGRRIPMTVEEIFRAVPAYRIAAGPEGDPRPESVRRMFERDKDELRGLGIPIETESFAVGFGTERLEGYVLQPGALYLPYLRVVEASEGEWPASAKTRPAGAARRARAETGDEPTFARADLELALDALREAAEVPGWPFAAETRSAFRKLAFDVGAPPGEPAVRRAGEPGGAELADALQRLGDALLRRKRVAFRYHGLSRGEPTKRDVAPYGLLMERGTWYLVGHDALRDALRMFHVGRIEGARVNPSAPSTPDYEIPDDFDLSDYRDRAAWELGDEDEEISARVRFTHPLSLWAERNGFGELERSDEDGAVRRFAVRHVRPFLCWVLGLGGEARILAPRALAEELRELAATIGGAHG